MVGLRDSQTNAGCEGGGGRQGCSTIHIHGPTGEKQSNHLSEEAAFGGEAASCSATPGRRKKLIMGKEQGVGGIIQTQNSQL